MDIKHSASSCEANISMNSKMEKKYRFEMTSPKSTFKMYVYTVALMISIVLIGGAESARVKRQSGAPELQFEDFKIDVAQRQTDLILIMDRSFGMGKQWFYVYEKKLARALLERYVILHPDYVRLAVISFAAEATVDVDSITNPGLNKCHLFNGGADAPWFDVYYQTDGTKARTIERGTNIRAAFQKAKEIFQSPENLRKTYVKKVILMLTDGDYDSREDPYQESEELKALGYTIYTVGLGNWLETGNVRVLATKPQYYGNFEDWEAFVKRDQRSPGPYSDALLVQADSSRCTNCTSTSSCFCEVLTGDYLCKCPPGFGHENTQCYGCKYHTYKSEPGNHGCVSCPSPAGTMQKNSSSLSKCICPGDEDCVSKMVNLCGNSPCRGENEQCIFSGSNAFQCLCKPGYLRDSNNICMARASCPINGDSPCANGYCVDMVEDYTCECEFGFTGRHCDININECRYNPCENGATCVDLINQFKCQCLPGFEGTYCQDPIPTTTTTTTTPTTTTTTTTTTTPTTTKTPTTTSTSVISTTKSKMTMTPNVPASPTPRATSTPAPSPTLNVEDKTSKPAQFKSSTTVASTRDPNALASSTGFSTDTIIIIAASAGGGLLLIILISVLVCCLCCRRQESHPPTAGTTNIDKPRTSSVRFAKRPRGSIYKSISQKFSGIWKNKTMRGGMWVNDDNTKTGAPSAPPKRRPDLISSSLTDPKGHILDEIVVSNDEINEPTGMEGWNSYLEDLMKSDIINYGAIAHVDGEKIAKTQNFMYNDQEIDKAHDLLMDRATNKVIKMHMTQFRIETNTGSEAIGKTLDGAAKPEVMLLSNTRKFVVVLVANDNEMTDMISLEKELQYVVDHINSEGY